ncbi:MAG: cysteine synthase A [Planctomycetota bacterium]|jgi:cysteine synthase A
MNPFDLPDNITDETTLANAAKHLGKANVILPRFSELADPRAISTDILRQINGVDPGVAHAKNLFRLHWYNDSQQKGLADVPGHLVLDQSLTGVAAPIVVMLGARFPMIGAHKVLAAYACLVTRLISGQFNPEHSRAIWPSTGNYCRGGIAISRILDCRGTAVLPAGMSRERFEWLENWVLNQEDIIRTPGSESNVKEIYDKCAELSTDPANVILNQFSEFANYLAHRHCTGPAVENVFDHLKKDNARLSMAAFVAGTGSGGTLAAGDYLKEHCGARVVAVEPTACPTMLYNGFGEHNIQGIGDKHIPLIQNVMNTDIVAAVSDTSCDHLSVLFNSTAGQEYLSSRRGIDATLVKSLQNLGLSGIANVLAAIKTAKLLDLPADKAVMTIATDSGGLYASERQATESSAYANGFDQVSAAEVYSQHMLGAETDHLLELNHRDRNRVFNLGYYTWVEQQGVASEDFESRRDQSFWNGLQKYLPIWDEMIDEFNLRTGVDRSK